MRACLRILALFPTLASAGPGAPFPLRETIAQLGADEIEDRTGAARALSERLGVLEGEGNLADLHEAMDALRRAAGSEDPETSGNAKEILRPFQRGNVRWTASAESLPSPFLLAPFADGLAAAGRERNGSRYWLARLDPRSGKAAWIDRFTRPLHQLWPAKEGVLAFGADGANRAWIALYGDAADPRWLVEQLSGAALSIQHAEDLVVAAGFTIPAQRPAETKRKEARQGGWACAIRTGTGRIAWERGDLPGPVVLPPVRHAAGIVVCGASHGGGRWIALLDSASGKTLWEARPEAGHLSLIQPLKEGILAVGIKTDGTSGWVELHDAANGKVLWTYAPPEFLPACACPLPDGGILLAGQGDGGKARLAVLDGKTGALRREDRSFPGQITHAQALPEGILVCGISLAAPSGMVHLIDPSTGAVRWKDEAAPISLRDALRTAQGILVSGVSAGSGDDFVQPGWTVLYDPATGARRLEIQGHAGELLPTPYGLASFDEAGIRLRRLHDADAETKGR